MQEFYVIYTREDIDFAIRLQSSLSRASRAVFIDVAGEIFGYGIDFDPEAAARENIISADGIVFVVSEGSVASEVCLKELAIAVDYNKLIIPVIYRAFSQNNTRGLPNSLKNLDYLDYSRNQNVEETVQAIFSIVQNNSNHLRHHTTLLKKASEWHNKGRNGQYLLQGNTLDDAQVWLDQAKMIYPYPSRLHSEYIAASKDALISQSPINRLKNFWKNLFQPPPRLVFISYRRVDSIYPANEIHKRLVKRLGKDKVFIDSEDIEKGADFPQFIQSKIQSSLIMLVIIGPYWLEELRKRAEINEPDYVKIEVETALSRPALSVIPILLSGTNMPQEADLPKLMKPLSRKNAITVRAGSDFDTDMNKLIAEIMKSKSKPN